jgi:hypothetical protein
MSKKGVLSPEWGLLRTPSRGERHKALSRFITKFTSLIVAVLSCFDRVIFKGHLALAAPSELERFVDLTSKVRRTEFMKTMAPQYSNRLVEHAQNWARKADRIYEYHTGDFRKDQWAQKLIRDQGIVEGLVGVLCTLETCSSFALIPGPDRPQFVSRPRQQRVLYPELRQLTESKVVDGRSDAGFNPERRDDVRLFQAVLDGDHIARGFRNGDIRQPLFGLLKTTGQQRRASAAVGRLLKRLHVRHLVAKIPHTRRWRVTERGRHLLGAAVQLYRCSWPELAAWHAVTVQKTSPHLA